MVVMDGGSEILIQACPGSFAMDGVDVDLGPVNYGDMTW